MFDVAYVDRKGQLRRLKQDYSSFRYVTQTEATRLNEAMGHKNRYFVVPSLSRLVK